MIRTKGEAGTGNVVSAVQHARIVASEIEYLQNDGDIEEIVDHIMTGFKRINSASAMNLGDSKLRLAPMRKFEQKCDQLLKT